MAFECIQQIVARWEKVSNLPGMNKWGWGSLTLLWKECGIDLTTDSKINQALDDHPTLQACASDKTNYDQRTGEPISGQNPCFQPVSVTSSKAVDRSIGRKRLWLQDHATLGIGAK